ncbi:MAG TPA: glycosyltransferase family 39 protein, partial [Caldilineaceae bacterium]|nr:glycosyltransferase family 39 protein [Caldilineaceae bacterium]
MTMILADPSTSTPGAEGSSPTAQLQQPTGYRHVEAARRKSHTAARLRLVHLLVAAVAALGLTLRVWNLNFDQGIGSHPDERSTACFYATTIALPESWQQFWDPRQSPLNPLWDRTQQTRRSFTYGHFPLYLGVAMGNLWHGLAPLADAVGAPAPAVQLMARANEACDGLAVAGRFTIALLDTLTIWLIFLLGRRAFGPWAGLAAAAFYAVTAQAVQLSHFFAMDPASTTFTVLAVLASVMMVQERSLRAALLAGVAAGLAIASKFSALPVLAVPAAASVLWLANSKRLAGERAESPPDGFRRQPPAISQLKALVSLCLAPLVAALAFFVASPYAVLDWSNFIQATLVE